MKRKILAFVLTSILCLSLAIPGFAASSKVHPSVEAMFVEISKNSVGGISPTVYYRNNSGKEIKYIYWYLTAYNAVGDPEKSYTGETTIVARSIGPIEPFTVDINKPSYYSPSTNKEAALDSPFRTYTSGHYFIAAGRGQHLIYHDKYGNPYSFNGTSILAKPSQYIYLSDDEIQNALYTQWDKFEIAWYSSQIRSVRVRQAIVEYMDGTKETISEDKVNSPHMNASLDNLPYEQLLSQYSAVYNYKDYVAYNADLVAVYGENLWKLLQHFINSGMKEGRQGSSEFNLAAYKANNPDLVALFGDDNAKYYEHYMAGGKAEGRIAV